MTAFFLTFPRGPAFLVIGGAEASVMELLDLDLEGGSADSWGSHEVGWVVALIAFAASLLTFGSDTAFAIMGSA